MLFFWKKYDSWLATTASMMGSILVTAAAVVVMALIIVHGTPLTDHKVLSGVIVVGGIAVGIAVFIALKKLLDRLTDAIARHSKF